MGEILLGTTPWAARRMIFSSRKPFEMARGSLSIPDSYTLREVTMVWVATRFQRSVVSFNSSNSRSVSGKTLTKIFLGFGFGRGIGLLLLVLPAEPSPDH